MLPNTILAIDKWPKIFKFRQSGKISPNLVTLRILGLSLQLLAKEGVVHSFVSGFLNKK